MAEKKRLTRKQQILVEESMTFAYGVANKVICEYQIEDFHNEKDDIDQVAMKALVDAALQYRENSNARFTTYAHPYVRFAVIKYIAERYRQRREVMKEEALWVLLEKEVRQEKAYEELSLVEVEELREIIAEDAAKRSRGMKKETISNIIKMTEAGMKPKDISQVLRKTPKETYVLMKKVKRLVRASARQKVNETGEYTPVFLSGEVRKRTRRKIS